MKAPTLDELVALAQATLSDSPEPHDDALTLDELVALAQATLEGEKL